MPPRAPPKIFQILVKTHKLTVFLTLPNTTPISTVKDETLSALTDSVAQGLGFPAVNTTDDFVLSREVKEGRRGTGRYEELDDVQILKDVASNWDAFFVQFKNEDGQVLPVEVSIPSIDDDEDPEVPASDAGMEMEVDADSRKAGKRKAPSE